MMQGILFPLKMKHVTRKPTLALAAALCVGLAGAQVGCNVAGFAAAALPPPTIEASYQDLGGHSAAVIVWAAPEIQADYPALTRQIGQRLQTYLETARDDGNRTTRDALEGMSFPLPSSSYVRAFKNDPTLAYAPPEEIASLAGAERVVYVEITRFTTGGGAAAGLVRGLAEVNLTIYEVAEPVVADDETSLASNRGTAEPAATEGYREAAIIFAYPPDGPSEGSARLAPADAYRGLALEVTDGVAERLVEHRGPDRLSS